MSRSFGRGLLPLFLLASAINGCGCDDEPVEAAALAFLSPAPGNQMRLDADKDRFADNGFQVDVVLKATGFFGTGSVKLTNTSVDGAPVLEADVGEDGRATFLDVTLQLGSNTLQASLSHGGPTVTVEASYELLPLAAPECSFVNVTANTVLGAADDKDAGTPGMQANISVECNGEGVEDGAPVGLRVAGAAADLSGTLSVGRTTFAGTTLPEGQATLTAYLLIDNTEVGTGTLTLTVDTGSCVANVTSPANGLAILANADLDAETPDVADVDVVVNTTNCGEGSPVALITQGQVGSIAGVVGADGNATIRAQFGQGALTFHATVSDGTGAGLAEGRSLDQVHVVDTIAPQLVVESPDEGAVLVGSTDADNDPANGHNSVAVLRLVDGSDVSNILAQIDGDEATQLVAQADEFGVVRFSLVLDAGDHTIVFSAADPAGNVASASRNVTVDMVIPSVVLVTPAEDVTLLAEGDADPEAEGFQINCALRVDGFESVSGLEPKAFCSSRAADERGEFNGPWTDSALGDFAVDGTATAVLTVGDGRYEVVAGVWTRNGEGNRATSSPARIVTVDGTAPTLTFVQPADGAFLNSATADLELAVTDAEAGQPVAISVDGELLVLDPEAVVDANGRVLVAAALLTDADPADGAYTLTATASDLAGNAGSAVPVTVTIDTAAPQLRVFGLDGDAEHSERVLGEGEQLDASQNANLDWGGNIADGLQYGFRVEVPNEVAGTLVSLVLNGAPPIVAQTVQVGERRYADFTNQDVGYTLPDGGNRVEVTVGDAAGNSSQAGITMTVTTGNRYVRIVSPADGTSTNAQTLTVDGISNLDVGVGCTLSATDGGVPVTLDGTVQVGGSLRWTGLALAGEGAWALTVSCATQPDPVVTLAATSVTIDRTGPSLAFVGLPENGVYNTAVAPDSTAGGHYRMNIVVSAAANATCTVDGAQPTATLNVVGGGVDATYDSPVFVGGANCSFTFAGVSLADEVADPDSQVTLSVSANDAALNPGNASAAVVVDRVGPVLSITDPVSNAVLGVEQDINQVVPNLQYSVLANVSGAAANSDVTLSWGQEQTSESTAGSGTVTFFGVTLLDGTHTLTATATDDHGNVTQAHAANITVDAVGPAIEILSPQDGALLGVADDVSQLAGFQVTILASVSGLQNGATVTATGLDDQVIGTGQVAGEVVTIAGATLAENETQTITLVANDGINQDSDSVSVTVDTLPPTIDSFEFVGDDGDTVQGLLALKASEDGNVNSAGFQGTVRLGVTGARDGSTLRIFTNNPVPNTQVGSATVAGATLDVAVSIAEGLHTLTVEAEDEVGNTSSPGAGTGVRVDVTAPSAAVTAPGNGSTLLVADDEDLGAEGLQFTLSASTDAEAGTSVSFQNGGIELGTGTVANGAASFAAVLPEGPVTLTVVTTDLVGNSTTSEVVSATVDSVAPTVSITSPAGGATLGDAQDVDLNTPGLQVDVGVTAAAVANGQTLTVRSTVGGDLCSALTSGAPLTIRCTLLEGANQNLTASVSDINGNIGSSAAVTVSVDLTAPSLTFVEPAANPALLNAGDDIDAGAEGFQTRFRLSSDAEGRTVDLTVGGVPAGSATVVGGLAIFASVTLAEASHAVRATVSDALANTTEVTITASVDLTAPTLTVVSPAQNPVTYTTDDDQVAGAPLDANMTVAVGGAIGGTLVVISDVDNEVASVNVAADGNLVLTGVQLSNATHTLTFTATDANGNIAGATVNAVVDVVAPSNFELAATVQDKRAGTVRLAWTEPGDDGDSGTVSSYEIRYSPSGINDQNFASATLTAESATPGGGANDATLDVTGLPFDVSGLRIAARAYDDVSNSSDLAQVSSPFVDLSLTASDHAISGSSSSVGLGGLCVGDFNNDGRADLVIPDRLHNGNTGRVTVLMGDADPDQMTQVHRIGLAAGGFFGTVCAVGDFNNDNNDDLAVGAVLDGGFGTGRVYVFNGSATGISAVADATITGSGALFGFSLSAAGNVTGDANTDLVVGAKFFSANAGKVYGFSGSALSGALSTADASFTVTGAAGSQAGVAVVSGFDLTGDGNGDVAIGAQATNSNAGEVLVVAGPVSGDLTATSPSVTRVAGAAGSQTGLNVGVAHVSGGTDPDLVVVEATGNRRILVFEGGVGFDATADQTISPNLGEFFGAVGGSSLCDLDGSGAGDLLVGNTAQFHFWRGGTLAATPTKTYSTSNGIINTTCGDFDGDGALDLAYSVGQQDGVVSIRY
jgi:large repetitive protein